MLYQILVVSLMIVVCNAQENRSDERTIDQNYSIHSLRNECRSLRQLVLSNADKIEKLTEMYNETSNVTAKIGKCCQFSYVNDGWVTLHNGYQYKKTPSRQSWNASRSVCQRWGGDLAFHGFYNWQNSETLYKVLSINQPTWIGLSDRDNEGRWLFVNGQPVDNSRIRWSTHQPDNYGNIEDCGEVCFGNWRGRTNDAACHLPQHAICEKRF